MRAGKRIVAVLLLLTLGACTALQPVGQPEEYLNQENPEQVRVILQNGAVVVLERPEARAQHLVGLESSTRETMNFDWANVHRVEADQYSSSRTIWLAAGIGAAAAALVTVLVIDKANAPPENVDDRCGLEFECH